MSAKGRVKCPEKQLPCLHRQMLIRGFDERSEPAKPEALRVSARYLKQGLSGAGIRQSETGGFAENMVYIMREAGE